LSGETKNSWLEYSEAQRSGVWLVRYDPGGKLISLRSSITSAKAETNDRSRRRIKHQSFSFINNHRSRVIPPLRVQEILADGARDGARNDRGIVELSFLGLSRKLRIAGGS